MDDSGYTVDINGDPSLIGGAISSGFSGFSNGLNFGGGSLGGGVAVGGLGGVFGTLNRIESALGYGQQSSISPMLLLGGAVLLIALV